jgi:uncharacterized membrane protein
MNTTIKSNPFRIFILLQALLCLLLLAGRVAWSKEYGYIFMIWNLILGLIPLYTSRILYRAYPKPSITSFIPFIVTVLFLPNAPYVITDLIHLHPHDNIPLWYDSLLLFTFAMTGLSWGLYCVRYIHKWLALWMPTKMVWISLTLIQLASGFGIFLGRVHRLNSWNIINRPYKLIELILHSFTQKECLFMSLSFGTMLMILYIILHLTIQYLKQQHYVIPEKNLE